MALTPAPEAAPAPARGVPDEISSAHPLRVVVAGCGVGGALLAKTLADGGAEVTVLERTNEFRRFGGPIQLASNALSTIRAIDKTLFDRLMEKFTFTGVRTSGIVDGVRDEWYCKFAAITDLPKQLRLPYTGVINRPELQSLLLEDVSAYPAAEIITGAAVTSFDHTPGGGVRVYTEGGGVYDADVLVGADGIWSNVRAALWDQPPKGEGSGCTYSGYTVFAGEATYPTDDYWDTGYKVFVGPKQYFVTSDVGAGRIQWYAFLALPPGTKARESNRRYLQTLFQGWSPSIHEALSRTPESLIEQRDLYDRPPSVLRSWSEGCVTLLGDACHPMMPNLGQGGCQALEDVFVLSPLLTQSTSRKEIPNKLKQYYYTRLPRTAAIQGLSRIASDFIINFFDTPARIKQSDIGLPYIEKLGLISVLVAFWQPLLPFFFQAQFSYLYSFAPSVLGEGELEQLVKTERARAREEAEAAWLKAEQEPEAVPTIGSFLNKADA